ncbi:MAG: alcohol dehydrogenase catalytic domain-containing protein [Candidatus Hydrothermia bacterium]
MKAIFLVKEKGSLELRDIPSIYPEDDEILVKTKYVILLRDNLTSFFPFVQEIVPGRYFVGEVVGTGPGVKKIRTGEVVTSLPYFPCDECCECQNDNAQYCFKPIIPGYNTPGVCQEYVKVREKYAVPLPVEVPLEIGAFVPLVTELLSFLPNQVEYGASAVISCKGIEHVLFTYILLNTGIWNVLVLSSHPRLRTFIKEHSGIFYTEDISTLYGLARELPEKPEILFEFSESIENLRALLKIAPQDAEVKIPWKEAEKDLMEIGIIKEAITRNVKLNWIKRFPTLLHSRKSLNFLLTGKINFLDFVTHQFNFNDLNGFNLSSVKEPVIFLIKMQ